MSVKRAQLNNVSDDFLKCRSRTYGHEWEDFIPHERHYWEGPSPDLQLRCVRCGTEKYLWLDASGDIADGHYIYPEGYKLAGLYRGDRLTSAELRAEILRRNRKTKQQRRLRAV